MEIVEIVLGDLRQGGEALREDMRVGHGNVANVASGKSVALGGILWIDLIGRGSDLYLLVNFLFVVQGEIEFVVARLQSESAAGDHKEAFLADFHFVIAGGKISQGKAAGAVGFGSIDVARAIFQL